jgi:hypothetical protein
MRGFLGSLISDPQCPRTTPTRLCRWRPALDVYPEIEFDGGDRLSVALQRAVDEDRCPGGGRFFPRGVGQNGAGNLAYPSVRDYY